MICPQCDADIIDGSEYCSNCSADLSEEPSLKSASAEESRLLVDQLGLLNQTKPLCVREYEPMQNVIEKIAAGEVGCVLVVRDEKLIGILTDRDIVRRVDYTASDDYGRPVSDFMTSNPESLPLDASVGFAMNMMAVGGYRHVPITEGGKPIGVVTVRDLMRYMGSWYPDLLSPSQDPAVTV
jgi:CBS domain-containing protein